jgi:hypothetical protein
MEEAMTKKFPAVLAAAVFVLLASAPAKAVTIQLINFDDLSDGGAGTPIANGYTGLDWNNFYVLHSNNSIYGPSGYVNGTVSQPNVAFNGFGNDASFSANMPFSLYGGYFTAAWNDGLTVTANGLLNGVQKYTQTFNLNTQLPLLIAFNWTDINDVTFSSSGGTNHGYGGSGEHFALDNLEIAEGGVSAVPLPAALPLFGSALLGLAGFGARKSRRTRRG